MIVLRPRTWTLLAALLGAFVTLLVMTLAQLQFAYRAFGLHVALETAAAFVAFLAAHLFYGRFRQSGRVEPADEPHVAARARAQRRGLGPVARHHERDAG